jgi:hypothetical protein
LKTYNFFSTLRDIKSAMGQTNRFALTLALIVTIVLVFKEIELQNFPADLGSGLLAYKNKSGIFWFILYTLIVYGLTFPVCRVKNQPFGKAIIKFYAFILVVILIILSFIIFNRLKVEDETFLQYYTPLLPFIGAISTVVIIFIQIQVAGAARRTSHSIKALFEMRTSAVFRDHIKVVNEVYPMAKDAIICPDEITGYFTHYDANGNPLTLDIKIKSAISSQLYLLNYYEFLAVGVDSNSLDEEFLFSTIASTLIGNYERGHFIIKLSIDRQPKAYEYLIRLVKKWTPRHKYEEEACNTKSEFTVSKDVKTKLDTWKARPDMEEENKTAEPA